MMASVCHVCHTHMALEFSRTAATTAPVSLWEFSPGYAHSTVRQYSLALSHGKHITVASSTGKGS